MWPRNANYAAPTSEDMRTDGLHMSVVCLEENRERYRVDNRADREPGFMVVPRRVGL
jgi:hypothetical protein